METLSKLNMALEGLSEEERKRVLTLALLDLALDDEADVLARVRHARRYHVCSEECLDDLRVA